MIVTKQMHFMCIFALLYKISCSGSEETVNIRAVQTRPRFLFNHPPAAVNEENISVAVLYDSSDDIGVRQSKTGKLDKPEISKVKSVTETTKYIEVSAKEKTETTTVIAKKSTSITKEPARKLIVLKSKRPKQSQTSSNYEEKNIPVAMVYEKVIDRENRAKKIIDTEVTVENEKKFENDERVTDDKKNTAPSDVVNSANRKPARRRILQKPKFRNNPTADYIVPVAIVYDKVIDKTNRHTVEPNSEIKTNKTKNKFSLSSSSRSTSKLNEEFLNKSEKSEEISNETQKNTNYDLKDIKIFTNDNITDKPTEAVKTPQSKQLHLEYKIPVSVVYDKEPIAIKRIGNKSGVVTRVLKQTRNLPNTTSNSNKGTEEQIPTKVTSTNRNTQSDTIINKIVRIPINLPRKEVGDLTNAKASIADITESKIRTRERNPVVPIITSENKVFSHNGEFTYSYEGGDGTKAYSSGVLKTVDEDKAGEAVVGGFSYKDKDGNDFSLSYTADENGYRPVGAHLPTPPPIPPAIARALEYLATKTTPEPVTETLE